MKLKAIRSEHDPAQIEELEHTKRMLSYWQTQLKALSWDTETEDGQKIRIVDKPHRAVLEIVGLNNEKLSEVMRFPSSKRGIINMLQLRLAVFPGTVEAKAVFPIQPIGCQLLQPDYR